MFKFWKGRKDEYNDIIDQLDERFNREDTRSLLDNIETVIKRSISEYNYSDKVKSLIKEFKLENSTINSVHTLFFLLLASLVRKSYRENTLIKFERPSYIYAYDFYLGYLTSYSIFNNNQEMIKKCNDQIIKQDNYNIRVFLTGYLYNLPTLDDLSNKALFMLCKYLSSNDTPQRFISINRYIRFINEINGVEKEIFVENLAIIEILVIDNNKIGYYLDNIDIELDESATGYILNSKIYPENSLTKEQRLDKLMHVVSILELDFAKIMDIINKRFKQYSSLMNDIISNQV